MHISHIALWTRDIEVLKDFYVKYFGGIANKKYQNQAKGFESYFISFPEGSALEIMSKTTITEAPLQEYLGYCHLAIKTSGRLEVDILTERLRADGIKVVSEPRTTGDGYYESVVEDPSGNKVEITA